LAPVSAVELATQVIKNIVAETKINPAEIDEVIVGNILSAGQKQGIARQASINAGIPQEVPAYSVNMICGSGMKSIINAVNRIQAGDANLILAGGTESMSNTGFVVPATIRNGHKMGNITILDQMICDGLSDAFTDVHMGITAENIAEKYGITRQAQDEFAIRSQQKAIVAVDGGKFKDEIVPIEIASKKETIVFDTDEYPNRNTNFEKLSQLKPAFKKDGTVTAGNASGINDGASFVMIASEEAVKKFELRPLVEIIATGQGGVDPNIMGIGPVPAIANALKKSGIKLSDMEVLELNEAFAAQSLGVVQQLCKDHNLTSEWLSERTNVNGGAIALGHPIGASGNRIVVSLIHELIHSGKTLGLAALCIGGGMGTAVIVRRT
jgi:acetyl-CoA C-acetyltransferase